MKKISLLIVVIVCVIDTYSQDPNFSQFFVSPLTLNPALTGKFDGLVRVGGNHRNQWPSINNAFITSTVSADFTLLKNKLSENDQWGIGFLALTDKSAAGQLKSSYLSLSTAYHKALDIDGYHILSAGFQISSATKSLNGNLLNLEDELDLNGTWQKPSNDPISNRMIGVRYMDVNIGLVYQGLLANNTNLYAGFSAYHLNKPVESFYTDGRYVLPVRYTLHSGVQIPSGENALWHITALYSRQNLANNFVAGAAYEYFIGQDEINPVSVYLGTWIRMKDAIIPYMGLEFSGLRLGASYDVNISSLKTGSNYRGGIEVSLIYIMSAPSSTKGVMRCPKF